jgi:molybdopterin molybdotransferase
MAVGLPGHPFSCMTALIFVVLPILCSLTGGNSNGVGRYLDIPVAADVQGRTGPDEFIPMKLEFGQARPVAAKSGYVSAMKDADGFILLPSDRETLRKGESARIWLW